LNEGTPVLVEVNVGVDLQTLYEITVRRRVAGAERHCIVGLDAFA
jgi:molybdate transport system ATP-binding protein